jgi:outer membrane protein
MKKIFFVSLLIAFGTCGFSQEVLSLKSAIELALNNNYGILLSKQELAIAELNDHIGMAGMLPGIDASGSRNYQVNNTYQEYFDRPTREVDDARSNSLNAGIQLNWIVFDGFHMFVRKNKLEQILELTEAELRESMETTVAEVISAYYNIVVQKHMLDLYEDAMKISSERKRYSEAIYQIGSGSELSFLQASVDFNADSSNWLSQKLILDNSKTALNKTLSRNLASDFATLDEIPLRPDIDFETIVDQALQSNPEIQMARVNISIASLNIKESNSFFYPRLTFSTGYNYARSLSEVGLIQQNRNLGYYAGGSINFNIFDGFVNQRNSKVARIQEESAKMRFDETQLDIVSRIRNIYNDYITNIQLINLEKENIELAKRNFNIAQETYKLGALTDIELRETQNKMMDAEFRFRLAQYRSKTAETELLLLGGEILNYQ